MKWILEQDDVSCMLSRIKSTMFLTLVADISLLCYLDMYRIMWEGVGECLDTGDVGTYGVGNALFEESRCWWEGWSGLENHWVYIDLWCDGRG